MAKSNLGKILAGITIIGAGVALGLAVYNKLDAIEHELDNDEFEDDEEESDEEDEDDNTYVTINTENTEINEVPDDSENTKETEE